MMKLKKFYAWLHKSETVTLESFATGSTLYTGPVKSIPDKFDNWKVYDFNQNDEGETTFLVA